MEKENEVGEHAHRYLNAKAKAGLLTTEVTRMRRLNYSRFKGEDYIGIVPHTTIPSYCESMFPKRFGTILDFMHIYQEELL